MNFVLSVLMIPRAVFLNNKDVPELTRHVYTNGPRQRNPPPHKSEPEWWRPYGSSRLRS
jgi:hypothetical protein